jgi:alpha-aminoadipate carrier protein LysW
MAHFSLGPTVCYTAKQFRVDPLTFEAGVYNTLVGAAACRAVPSHKKQIKSEDGAVLRCPDCSAELDVDEDEVEEGEILSCPECESELEVSQTHPVALNPISDDIEEEDDEEDEDDEDDDDEDEAEDEDELPDEDEEDEKDDEE